MSPTLGETLSQARSKAGLSLRGVERLTGIQNAHLSQIEKGTISAPAVSILWELANLYELDFTKLMRLAGHAGARGGSTPSRSLVGTALHTIRDFSTDEERELLKFLEDLRRRRRDE